MSPYNLVCDDNNRLIIRGRKPESNILEYVCMYICKVLRSMVGVVSIAVDGNAQHRLLQQGERDRQHMESRSGVWLSATQGL